MGSYITGFFFNIPTNRKLFRRSLNRMYGPYCNTKTGKLNNKILRVLKLNYVESESTKL